MNIYLKFPVRLTSLAIGHALLAGLLATALPASAQEYQKVQTAKSPLVLKSRGSFFVGGEKVQQTKVELGNLGPDDTITVNQMYVDYMIAQGARKAPVVLVHGATLSGKSYDTTPDGRMGWFEYFVRKGHPTYVPDQVGRARSGFNQALFNSVRAGTVAPSTLPPMLRLADNVGSWTNFRIGPTPGVPFPDSQFPSEFANEMSKQAIPDLSAALPTATNPTLAALSDLSQQVGGAVLLGHSQGGRFPVPAALLDPKRFKALVLLEPGSCTRPVGRELTDQDYAKLAGLPILVMFGDHLESPTGIPLNWKAVHDDCRVFIARANNAGAKAEMLNPSDLGIRGNSHMLMLDKNNLQVADLIMGWIDKNAKSR